MWEIYQDTPVKEKSKEHFKNMEGVELDWGTSFEILLNGKKKSYKT